MRSFQLPSSLASFPNLSWYTTASPNQINVVAAPHDLLINQSLTERKTNGSHNKRNTTKVPYTSQQTFHLLMPAQK